ncbi:major facilitator superfamily domain-containing protein [Parathielavia appendiculata]|uniref:Molybdate-anion transporter n=1 Tax=Parathielavia appendiculata TaxID=2587402 RepID=A0AAN6TYH4_9PEZI|nr:major facilitator superfamily domain-containing protein [Parathielavia appendiculata]
MVFYEANTALFALGGAYLLHRQYYMPGRPAGKVESGRLMEDVEGTSDDGTEADSSDATRKFQINFFSVYALAVAVDWLQGPHIYAIYRYDKQLPEKSVAALYAAGFVAGAASASFAGGLADRYGRRAACFCYCAVYALACLSMLSDDLLVLFLGRLCGGISTTLLFSVFPAWMITEYHSRGLQGSELDLSSIFSKMSSLSCAVAISSGILGDALVTYSGSRVGPFLAATACAAAAGYRIVTTWEENYGTQSSPKTSTLSGVKSILVGLLDLRVLSLGITSSIFEGTMYLVVFFWSAALKSARAHAGSEDELPFGLIFSSFMCCMLAGSAIFALSSHSHENVTFMLMAALLTVSCCLSAAVLATTNEVAVFWAVCAIELCIGVYFPSIELLKSEAVEDGVRGRTYSLMRVPLNVFVVVAHALDQEGDEHRNNVFMVCAVLLIVAFFIIRRAFAS